MNFVLDCSMSVSWCFEDEATASSRRIRDQLLDDTALVPRVLWDLEVWNVLLVAIRRGRIRSVEENARLLAALPVRRVEAPIERALGLGMKHRISSHDALYLALALQEQLPLATLDQELARAARSETLEILGAES